jgi:hypothetical protein
MRAELVVCELSLSKCASVPFDNSGRIECGERA